MGKQVFHQGEDDLPDLIRGRPTCTGEDVADGRGFPSLLKKQNVRILYYNRSVNNVCRFLLPHFHVNCQCYEFASVY